MLLGTAGAVRFPLLPAVAVDEGAGQDPEQLLHRSLSQHVSHEVVPDIFVPAMPGGRTVACGSSALWRRAAVRRGQGLDGPFPVPFPAGDGAGAGGSLETPHAETASISTPATSATRIDRTVITTHGCVHQRVAHRRVAAWWPAPPSLSTRPERHVLL